MVGRLERTDMLAMACERDAAALRVSVTVAADHKRPKG